MTVNIKMLAGQLVYLFLFFTLPLFLAAGTIAWLAGWIFVVLFFTFTAALTLWLLKHNPDLLKERMAMFRSDQKTWDKVGFVLIVYHLYRLAGPDAAGRGPLSLVASANLATNGRSACLDMLFPPLLRYFSGKLCTCRRWYVSKKIGGKQWCPPGPTTTCVTLCMQPFSSFCSGQLSCWGPGTDCFWDWSSCA